MNIQSLELIQSREKNHYTSILNVGSHLFHSVLTLTVISVTRYIVGYKKEESDALLKFLYDHIAYGADFQVRVKWQEKTVVV